MDMRRARELLRGAFSNGRAGHVTPLQSGQHFPTAPIASRAAATEEARLEACYHNLERAIDYVGHADNKILIALAFQGAFLAGLGAFADPLRVAIEHQRWHWAPPVILVLLVLGLVAAAYSLLHAILALLPRILESEKQPHHEDKSPFFFGDIARMPLPTFRERMLGLDTAAIEDELIRQTHLTAGIAADKYWNVRHQYIGLALQLMLLLLASGLAEIGKAS